MATKRSCFMAGFGVNSVEPSGSASTLLVIAAV
jgi:hypothetical protein